MRFIVVGPACTLRLAQYGAEIIKVESPDGDLMRALGGASPSGEHSGTYLHLNRGKRNLCLDMKKAGGRAIVDRLVWSSDVIITNMRPQALERLKLDAESVRSIHPEKIHCLITGYGIDGPYSGQPAYDSVVQAATGMTGLTMMRDGSPTYVPLLICDHVVGEIAAGAIAAAVVEQQASRSGCSIEVPMFETMAAFVLQEHLGQHSFDPPVGPPGDQRLLSPHNRPVKTADGWIAFTINTDAQVRAFFKAVGRSDLVDDPRFSSVAARAENVKEWFAVRGAPLTEYTTEEWLEKLRNVDIPVQACHTLESLPHDAHLTAVGLLTKEDHPVEGRTVAIRPTISFNGTYPTLRSVAQPRGWETKALLEEFGYSPDQIEEFIADGSAFPTTQSLEQANCG